MSLCSFVVSFECNFKNAAFCKEIIEGKTYLRYGEREDVNDGKKTKKKGKNE